MNCKYCNVEIKKANKPNKIQCCSKCRYKHYRDLNLEAHKKRQSSYYTKRAEKKKIKQFCQYCNVVLPYADKDRKILACSKCRYKHYQENFPEAFKERGKKDYKKNAWKPERRFNDAKQKAKKNNRAWEIELDDYKKLISKKCEYCKGPLSATACGLDRKDSNLGYTLDNVVPCCGNCNFLKSNKFSYDEMKVIMKAVLKLRRKKTIS